MYAEMIFFRFFLTLSIEKVTSIIVWSEVDFCLDKTCTQLHPTCAVRFVGSDALNCFNAQEIIPSNPVRSVVRNSAPGLVLISILKICCTSTMCAHPGCGKVFKSQRLILEHLSVQSDKLICAVCGRRCPSASKLRRHGVAHNDAAYVCEQCGKKYHSEWYSFYIKLVNNYRWYFWAQRCGSLVL